MRNHTGLEPIAQSKRVGQWADEKENLRSFAPQFGNAADPLARQGPVLSGVCGGLDRHPGRPARLQWQRE